MPNTLTMPKLSPTMEMGTIVKWHKKVGDKVEANELLMEVATDKATVEFNAIDSGWIRKILIEAGSDAEVNQAIAIMTDEEKENIEGYKPEGAVKEVAKEVSEVKEAAPQKQTAPSKALQQPAFVPEQPLENYEFGFPVGEPEKHLKASPLAKKLAKEKNLDITTVKGTGPGGRIVSSDLEKAQSQGPVSFGRRDLPTDKPGSFDEISLSQMRKVIAQRLQEAKSFIPHFYVTQSINANSLVDIREQLSKNGLKVTYNDFIVRACALALREHPEVNSGFDSVKNVIVRFKTIDISIAVSLPEGLVTPIIRHADYKNLGEISQEIRSLARKAKEGKLDSTEYKGGSFTISNLGMYGVSDFVAIINPPQAAILAISGIQNIPVVSQGEVVPGKVMNLTLSADHRVIDGVGAAKFLNTIQKYLENPASLLI